MTLPATILQLTNEHLPYSGKTKCAISVAFPNFAFDCSGSYLGVVKHAIFKGQCSVSQNGVSTEDISYAWVTMVCETWHFSPLGEIVLI